MREFAKEFRVFIMRGNVLQVAVAFVLGLYFKDVIDRFTNGIVLALIAAIFGKTNFVDITWTLNKSEILIGAFLNAIINFVLIGFVLFLVIKAYETMMKRFNAEDDEPKTPDQELLTEIRDILREQHSA
jgi:large conductance mechanosensitive channel